MVGRKHVEVLQILRLCLQHGLVPDTHRSVERHVLSENVIESVSNTAASGLETIDGRGHKGVGYGVVPQDCPCTGPQVLHSVPIVGREDTSQVVVICSLEDVEIAHEDRRVFSDAPLLHQPDQQFAAQFLFVLGVTQVRVPHPQRPIAAGVHEAAHSDGASDFLAPLVRDE